VLLLVNFPLPSALDERFLASGTTMVVKNKSCLYTFIRWTVKEKFLRKKHFSVAEHGETDT